MCLISKTKVPKKAKRDITVYKVLERKGLFYQTPYRCMAMEKGYHYYQTGKKFEIKYYISGNYLISEGLHAYTTKVDAISTAIHLTQHFPSSFTVVKMRIPKGSEYFIDEYKREICSDNLIWE